MNDKGQQICFTYSSTEHLTAYHKKDKKDDKGDTEKKPGVHAVRTTTGRKKGHERMAEKVWDEFSDSSENE